MIQIGQEILIDENQPQVMYFNLVIAQLIGQVENKLVYGGL